MFVNFYSLTVNLVDLCLISGFGRNHLIFLLLFVGDECAFAQSKDFRWSIKVPELINWSNELVLFCSVCVIA